MATYGHTRAVGVAIAAARTLDQQTGGHPIDHRRAKAHARAPRLYELDGEVRQPHGSRLTGGHGLTRARVRTEVPLQHLAAAAHKEVVDPEVGGSALELEDADRLCRPDDALPGLELRERGCGLELGPVWQRSGAVALRARGLSSLIAQSTGPGGHGGALALVTPPPAQDEPTSTRATTDRCRAPDTPTTTATASASVCRAHQLASKAGRTRTDRVTSVREALSRESPGPPPAAWKKYEVAKSFSAPTSASRSDRSRWSVTTM